MSETVNCALRPDAQAFDEVRIVTVPRYKESELSGDEWRISATIQLLRKGKVICERRAGSVQAATALLPGFWLQVTDEGNGYFAGDGVHCDQEGCSAIAVVRYRKLSDFCSQGHRSVDGPTSYRHFCWRHKIRGDCGLDDADGNYVDMGRLVRTPEQTQTGTPTPSAGLVRPEEC